MDRAYVRRMVQSYGDAQDHLHSQVAAHMCLLRTLANLVDGPVVECGVGYGFSTQALIAGLNDGSRLVSYDHDPKWEKRARAQVGNVPWDFRAKDSVEAAKEWPDGSVALFFLDTSHFYEPTRDELAAWLPKMKRDGILCGHDYAKCIGVERAVKEFLMKYRERFTLQTFPHDCGFFILWPL